MPFESLSFNVNIRYKKKRDYPSKTPSSTLSFFKSSLTRSYAIKTEDARNDAYTISERKSSLMPDFNGITLPNTIIPPTRVRFFSSTVTLVSNVEKKT